MECQSGAAPGAAPASVAAADISALLPESVDQGSLVREDQREVSPLSGWDDVACCRNPYPSHYSSALACSLLLYPAPRRLPLRGAYPCGRTTGLPRSAAVTRVAGSQLSAGGTPSAPGEGQAPGPDHAPFGPSVTASYACCQ